LHRGTEITRYFCLFFVFDLGAHGLSLGGTLAPYSSQIQSMIDIGERIETSCQLTYPPGKSGDIQFLLKDNPKSNWCRCRGLAEDSADGEGSVTADSRQPTGLRMGSMMRTSHVCQHWRDVAAPSISLRLCEQISTHHLSNQLLLNASRPCLNAAYRHLHKL